MLNWVRKAARWYLHDEHGVVHGNIRPAVHGVVIGQWLEREGEFIDLESAQQGIAEDVQNFITNPKKGVKDERGKDGAAKPKKGK